jgi:hypothetical protein
MFEHYGLVRDGQGFFQIPTDGATSSVTLEREAATALITITRGVVTLELLTGSGKSKIMGRRHMLSGFRARLSLTEWWQ